MAKNSPQDIKNREYFSANLNRIMKEKGVRQIDIHNDLDIPKSTITGYVKGRSLPTSGNLQKLADYLNVKKSDLDSRFSNNDVYKEFLLMLEKQLEEKKYLVNSVSKEKIFQKVKERERRDKELIERVKGMNRSVKPEEFLSTITESLEEYNPKNDYSLLMDLALKTSSILFWLDIVFQKRTSEFYIVFEDKNFNENYYTHFYEKINVLFEEIKAAALEEARKDKNDFEDYKLTWGLD
ncbi:helix-turn-helix domain-containing protein [Streptococcus suis]|uniref:helix-turn-helix domain-containing protein n=1 Tax=Streptococcus suis TaxID=1307 RepID=UPI000F63C299|nr:helix-turn-helix transcriptional regulator [Streptococcus suis]RRR36854.1 XRE family transcriptional regulator [Streptococcus suis]RRR41035.1 XRE family transcriptional regulator [Streptococcus suis]RRR62369.1 XRE family transcriptional regulator [Streptococcus suis]